MKWYVKFFAWLAKIFTVLPQDSNDGGSGGTAPMPPDPAQPVGQDAIAPQFVVWDDGKGEVGEWPITVQISDVQVKGGRLYWQQSGAVWPEAKKKGWKKPAIGNIWVLGKIKGKWHAATWDWIGPGQRIKQLPRFEETNDIHGVLEGWFPMPTEEVGFCISTFARDATRSVNERSNIVIVRWP